MARLLRNRSRAGPTGFFRLPAGPPCVRRRIAPLLHPLHAIALANPQNRHRRHLDGLPQFLKRDIRIWCSRKHLLKVTRVVNHSRALALSRIRQIWVAVSQRLRIDFQEPRCVFQGASFKSLHNHFTRNRCKVPLCHHPPMVGTVFLLRHHLEVPKGIVCPILVTVVDNLPALKRAA